MTSARHPLLVHPPREASRRATSSPEGADPDPGGQVTAIGLTRRVQALAAMGWPTGALARWAGGDLTRLAAVLREVRQGPGVGPVPPALADLVLELYQDLAMQAGPSPRTRRHAVAQGWAPPLAWDEDQIDDPHGSTSGLPTARERLRKVDVSALRELASWGVTAEEAADRLGVTPSAISAALRRAGAHDVIETMFRSAQRRAA